MIPVNQFILGSSDPLLYPSEKMTNSIDEQIAFLQSQKQAINLLVAVIFLKVLYLLKFLVMFMLQLMLNTMIMLNYLKNGLVVI